MERGTEELKFKKEMNIFKQILPNIKKHVKRHDFGALVKSNQWVDVGPRNSFKQVYIFRTGNELIHSIDGKVQKGKWELLNNKSLIIDLENTSSLYYIDFMDSNVLFLNSDNISEYKVFVDITSFEAGIDTFEKIKLALEKKYRPNNEKRYTENNNQSIEEHEKVKSNSKSKKAFVLQKDSKRVVGILSILLGVGVVIGTIIFNHGPFRYHVLNDKSMCPCGADISMSIDPTFFLVLMIFLIVFGLVLYIRNLEKTQ